MAFYRNACFKLKLNFVLRFFIFIFFINNSYLYRKLPPGHQVMNTTNHCMVPRVVAQWLTRAPLTREARVRISHEAGHQKKISNGFPSRSR